MLRGVWLSQIARILQADKVLTPAAYWQAQGKTTNQPPPENPHRWIARTITDILEKKDYLGHTVNFKTFKQSYKSKKKCYNTEDKRHIEGLDRLFKRIHDDNASGKLSDSRFQMLSDYYDQEEQAENIERFISKVKKYLDLDKLTPSVLNDMVKAVSVHTPDKSNGRQALQVDISYDLVGILPVSLLDSLKSEETA